jgi:hypothetical protein
LVGAGNSGVLHRERDAIVAARSVLMQLTRAIFDVTR